MKIVYKKLFPIEPIVCLNLMTISIREMLLNNLLIEMACGVNMGYNKTVCESITNGLHRKNNLTNENSKIQQEINYMLSWCLPINSIIPIVLLLFLGNFSDENKIRKPFLIMPTIGDLLSTMCCVLCVWYREVLPVEMGGIAHYVVPALFGTTPMLYMAAYTHIADASVNKTCIVRLAVMQVCINVSKMVGTVVSGYFFQQLGYVVLLLSCMFLQLTVFGYGLFLVEDLQTETKKSMRSPFSYTRVCETLQLVTSSTGIRRTNIVFLLVLQFLVVTVFLGEGNVYFWFTQQRYGWTNSDYAYFQGTRGVLNSLTLSIAVPTLSQLLHFHDITIITLSLLDKVVSTVVCITVQTSIGEYISMLVGAFTIAATSGIRSLSSTYISADNVGKIQSLLSIVQAIGTSVAAQIYNRGIYDYTHNSYPYAFLYLSIVICIVSVTLCTWKYYNEHEYKLDDRQDLHKKENSLTFISNNNNTA
ncbi:hypothetical protein RI129_012584 [Pyrocoelia pectoralis]|uniref:Solute carrier family 46 member 3 n=1 Tax=Pyrocoelia pectoralis TaxID=417401 RepID=A0AAN7V0P1_9COLE